MSPDPPQTIISRAGPDRGVPESRAGAAGTVEVGAPGVGGGVVAAAGVDGKHCVRYRPRRSSRCRSRPRCGPYRPGGASVVEVGVQVSVAGL